MGPQSLRHPRRSLSGHVEPQDLGHNLEQAMMNALQPELLEEAGATGTPHSPAFAVFDPRSPNPAVVHRVTAVTPHTPTPDEFADQPPRLINQQELADMTNQLDPWSALIIRQRAGQPVHPEN